MRTLCFGGSFNPIHHGHLICSRAVAETAGFDKILLIPTPQPPHKPGLLDLAPAADRLAMCRAAIEVDPIFEVSGIEVGREGPSYTIDTVRQLRSSGWGEVHWLIGADMLMYLPMWHKAEQLVDEVNFVIMGRPGWQMDWTALPANFRHLKDHIVEAPLVQISASDIRKRVGAGLSIDYLTPRSVCEYIRQHGLYQFASPR